MTEHVIRQVVIRGVVQGVGYREWTRYVARERGVEGWVRNRLDGSVEAVFDGSIQSVAGIIAACRKGPLNAVVESVEDSEATAEQLDLRGRKSFAVLPTV